MTLAIYDSFGMLVNLQKLKRKLWSMQVDQLFLPAALSGVSIACLIKRVRKQEKEKGVSCPEYLKSQWQEQNFKSKGPTGIHAVFKSRVRGQ